MANLEHLDIFSKGVAEWNRWRESEPTVWPDLLGEDLRKAKRLDGINLENANLLQVNLEGASLADANLRNANLCEANLKRAALNGADLEEANLYKAKLQEADLGRANLVHASLIKAEIKKTNFAFATLGETSFDQSLILGADGLDLIYHLYTAIIDVQVFEHAKLAVGRNPDLKQTVQRFFENAGVTERIIKAALEALSQPPEWRSCFISYSHTDKKFADLLSTSLARLRIPHCRDDQSIETGTRIFEKVAGLIINSNRTLLCCSWASLSKDWVEREVGVALEKEKKEKKSVLVPLDIDGCILDDPYRPDGPSLGHKLRDRLIGDFRGWRDPQSFDDALTRLAGTLRISTGLTG